MNDLMIPGYEEIEKCHSSNYGETLLQKNGEATNNLDPEHYFIPWITFNGVWEKVVFELALEDLKLLLCSTYLKDVPECNTNL